MVIRIVSVSSDVRTIFFGTPTTVTGMENSCSYVSLRVIESQKIPDSAMKKTNIRSSLLVLLNKKSLKSLQMLPIVR